MDFPPVEINPSSFFVTSVDTNIKQPQHDDLVIPAAETASCPMEFKVPQDVVHQGGGKSVPPSKVKAKSTSHSNEEYVLRRQKNNVAVRKSREKSKEKTMSTIESIERLKVENEDLEEKVEVLGKELATLKKVFFHHAKGFMGGGSDIPDLKQLEQLLGHKLTDKTLSVTPDTSTDR